MLRPLGNPVEQRSLQFSKRGYLQQIQPQSHYNRQATM